MNFLKLLSVLTLVLVSNFHPSLAESNKDKPVPGVMAPLRKEVLKLQPYLISDEKFSASKNQKEIQKSLNRLALMSKTLPAHKRLKTPGFAVSAKVLQEQLQATADIYKTGSTRLARRYLNASLKACSSCHTQVAGKTSPQWGFPVDRVQGSLLDQADFWFTVRHYSKALTLYERILRQAPSKNASLADAKAAMEKSLTINLRIRRSAAKAAATLNETLENPNLTKTLKQRAQKWIQSLKDLDVEKAPSSRTSSADKLETYAEKQLSDAEAESFKRLDDSQVVQFLFVSGLLYEFINFNPKKATGEILYWLAVSDHWLNDQFYYSLSNLYLEECIKKFPDSSIAPRCYKELEEKIKLAYTGSSGLNLPDEEKLYLHELKARIQN